MERERAPLFRCTRTKHPEAICCRGTWCRVQQWRPQPRLSSVGERFCVSVPFPFTSLCAARHRQVQTFKYILSAALRCLGLLHPTSSLLTSSLILYYKLPLPLRISVYIRQTLSAGHGLLTASPRHVHW